MAFVTTSAKLSLKLSNPINSTSFTSKHYAKPKSVLPKTHSKPKMIQSTTKPHTKTAAHVVDTRVASRVEAHHWIVVKPQSMRIFERAAVAQADVTRQLEKRKGAGARHRWVLRHVVTPPGETDVSVPYGDGIYVVMEAFEANKQTKIDGNPLTRRWLSAVERVGPLMQTVSIQTRRYDNLFTCKFHDVVFDPNANLVVLNSVNIDSTKPDSMKRVAEKLRHLAEGSVQNGQCLEFCVLHTPGEKSFLKTIEVYKDLDAMKKCCDKWDNIFIKSVQDDVIQSPRTKQIFKPVLFS